MKFNYKHLLCAVVLYPLSLLATDKPIYLDYDHISIDFSEKIGLIRVEKSFDDDGLAIAEKDGKSGLINTKGEVVIPFEYDAIDYDSKQYYKIFLNNRWGVVDKQFKTVLPPEYEEISTRHKYHLLYKDAKYLLANDKWEIITPTGFDEINVLSDDNIVVLIEGRWHFFDKETKHIDNVAYDAVRLQTFEGNSIELRYKGDFATMDAKTKKIIMPYGYHYEYPLGQNLLRAKKDGKFGIFNSDGEMVVPAIYDSISVFGDSMVSSVEKDGLVGVIDTKGEFVIPLKYLADRIYLLGDYRIRQTADKKWHILTRDDSKEIGNGFDKVYFVGDKTFAVKNSGKKYLADINNPSKILTTLDQYDDMESYHCGGCETSKFFVIKNGKYGLVNSQGKELIKPLYDNLSSWTTANLLFKKDNKYGVIDFNGNIVVKAKYDELEWLDCRSEEARGVARIGDKWQLVDINTQPISKLFDDKLIVIGLNDIMIQNTETKLYGLVDFNGKEIIPTQYSRLTSGKVVIEVIQNDKIAYFNRQGKQITPFIQKSALQGYDYTDDMLLITYLNGEKSQWTIYDIATGKALYTNEKPSEKATEKNSEKNSEKPRAKSNESGE